MNATQTNNNAAREAGRITHNRLATICPAAFSKTCSPKVTDKYQFVPTMPIVRKLEDRGFYPVFAEQNADAKNGDWAFHVIRFENPELSCQFRDELKMQLILTNSHDRTRRLSVMAGLFRMVCENGLIAPMVTEDDKSLGYSNRQLHLTKLNPEHVVDRGITTLDRAVKCVDDLKNCKLTRPQQLEYVRKTLAAIYGEERAKPLNAATWLEARRPEDEGNSAWLTFNRVQENFLKGGVTLATGRLTRRLGAAAPRTGAITRVRVNEFLWNEAVKFLKN